MIEDGFFHRKIALIIQSDGALSLNELVIEVLVERDLLLDRQQTNRWAVALSAERVGKAHQNSPVVVTPLTFIDGDFIDHQAPVFESMHRQISQNYPPSSQKVGASVIITRHHLEISIAPFHPIHGGDG